MERLPGPICGECRPLLVDDGTLAVCEAKTPGVVLDRPKDAAALLRLHQDILAGFASCWHWDDLARMRDLIHALPPGGYDGVIREELVLSLYGAVVISAAERHLDIREIGTNAGEDVEEMLEAVGRSAGDAWCAAFVSQCHRLAALWLCGTTTCPQEAAVQFLWGSARAAKLTTFTKNDVYDGKKIPRAGDVFIMAVGASYSAIKRTKKRVWINESTSSHTGMVVGQSNSGKTLTTIEGNTGPSGGREGDGVYMKTRKVKKHASAAKMSVLAFIRPGISF
jgi:hypothetical protein